MKLAVIVGRFQVDNLTMGHRLLLLETLGYDKVLIVIGESPLKNTRRNPLNSDLIATSIWDGLHNIMSGEFVSRIYISSLEDCHSDFTWSENLDKLIESYLIHGMTPTLLGGRDSFINCYVGKYPTELIGIDCKSTGTEVRKQVACTDGNNEDFRRGVIWAAYNRYPVVYSTVDIIPYDAQNGTILLGRKKGELKWRFVGGFVDINDADLQHAASRELEEEAGLPTVPCNMEYIGSLQVKDWRYQKEIDIVMTHVFVCDLFSQDTFVANDDIEQLDSFELESLSFDFLIPSHQPILKKFIEWKDSQGKLNGQ